MPKNILISFFWLALAFVVVCFALRVYAELNPLTNETSTPSVGASQGSLANTIINAVDRGTESSRQDVKPSDKRDERSGEVSQGDARDNKEAIVADVKHEEIKGPKYTIRVGLGGARKPIPTLKGNTVDERAKEWLQSQGSNGVKDSLHTWKRFGDEYKMDYTLPLCISWADSSLGKALKSKNNLSNYGNNDRGDVKHFDSVEEGIRVTFWALSHGKYMSGHTIIGTLSGEGRKIMGLPGCNEEKDYRKKCWATSMVVHSTNVVNCMSAIHNKQVTEKDTFRL